MPELPEVEMVRRSLEPLLVGHKIVGADVLFEDYLRECSGNDVCSLVEQRFHQLVRHGKYLYLMVDKRELETHLGMTGRLLVCGRGEERVKHTHVCLHLDSGQELRFIDPRRFGYLRIRRTGAAHERQSMLGIEPLRPDFTWQNVEKALRGRKAPLKSLLMDQKIVAGLGNIYADEALFRAQLNPCQPAGALSEEVYQRLCDAIESVIADALGAGGTTFSDYVDANGDGGEFYRSLDAYGREGQPCRHCDTPLVRMVLGGRSACYCSRCQPLV